MKKENYMVERKKELRKSQGSAGMQTYSRTIIENSLDLITILNSDGTIHYQNPSCKETLGYLPEEVITMDVFTFVHPEDQEEARKAFEQVLSSKKSRIAIESRVRHKDGFWRNLESIATQILDEDKKRQILINSRDITARITAEEELREKAHDLRGRIKELNCLFSVTDIMLDPGRTMTDSFQQIVDLISSSLQYPKAACVRLILNEEEFRTENFQLTDWHAGSEIRLQDERLGTVEFCYLWQEGQDEPQILEEEKDLLDAIARQIEGAILRCRMRQDLQDSEEKYRNLYETMAQGVIYQDASGLIISANPAATRILGLSKDNLEGLLTEENPDFQILNEDGSPLSPKDCPSMIALREGRKVTNFIMGIFNPVDNDYRWISVNAVPQWRKGEENPFQVYSTFEDITELKNTSEELTYRVSLEKHISEISTGFINLPLKEIDSEINQALARIGKFLGVDRSYVFLISEDGATLDNTHEWCADGIESQFDLLQNISIDCFPWWMGKLIQFEPILISNVGEMPSEAAVEKKFFQELDVNALICVPMAYGGNLKGFLGLDIVGENKGWSSQDVSLLRMLGEVVILALEHKKAERQLELVSLQEIRETFLDNFRRLCRDAREEEPIFEAATSWLTNHLGVDRGWIKLLEDDGRQICQKNFINEGKGIIQKEDDLPKNCLKSLQASDDSLIIENSHEETGFREFKKSYLIPYGINALLVIPFQINKKVSGFLFLEDLENSRPWQEDEIKLVRGVADQIAIACDRIRERQLRKKQRRIYTEDLESRVLQRTMELEDAKKSAEAASLAKSEFLANMSHELRTPLNSVLGFAEIIRDNMAGPVNEQQKEYLTDIIESGKHLLNLINDVLDLSKVEAGAMDLELETIELEDFFEQCLILFREKAIKHDIKLQLDLSRNIQKVVADRRKLMQVIINLLSNALKFTPDGGGVGVRTEIRNGHLLIEVWDTGIGIAEQEQKYLFQPFQQLESGKNKKYQGTGLGLSLCKNIVKLHGGSIGAESTPGQGSSFIISLPIDPLHSEKELEVEGKDFSPILQVQGLKFGIHNLDRLLVLHKNWELRFGLFNLFIHEVKGINEIVSLADVLRRGMRSRDTVIYDQADNSFFLILSGLEATFAEDSAGRFLEYLQNEGYTGEGRLSFFPDDGNTREELLAALADKKRIC